MPELHRRRLPILSRCSQLLLVLGALAFACSSQAGGTAGGYPDAGTSDATATAIDDAEVEAPFDAGIDAPLEASVISDGSAKDANACMTDAAVDDDPVCDACARSHCCEWIEKCDQSPSCKETRACLATCADGDTACVLSCSTAGGIGGSYLQEIGACVANNCSAQCTPDGG